MFGARCLALVGLVLLATPASPAAAAGASPVVAAARAHAKAHNLPIKQIKLDVGGRKVSRWVFPVLPGTYAEARSALSGPANKQANLVNIFSGSSHLTMNVKPNHDYLFSKVYKQDGYVYNHAPGALIAGFSLTPKQVEGMEKWIATEGPKVPGHCFAYLANAKVGANPLFHHLGVARSKDAKNGMAKLAWAGNEKVQVIGVCVADVAAFNKMKTPTDFLGAAPGAGVADSIHE